MSLDPLRLNGMAAPDKNDCCTAQDDVLDGAGIEDGFHSQRRWFAPGGVAFGFEVPEDVFGAVGVFFCVGNEDGGHASGSPFCIACRVSRKSSIFRPAASWGKPVFTNTVMACFICTIASSVRL